MLASSEASSKAILEELQPRIKQLILPTSYQGPTLPEIVTSVAKKYAHFASINTTEAIIVAMDCCIRMQALDGIWDLLNRVLEPTKLKELTGPSYSHYSPYVVGAPQGNTYADRVVLPLVSQLRQLSIKHNMLTALSPAFRQIARTYTQKVLGHIPSANPEKRLAQIRRWTCSCVPCNGIRTFLLNKPDRAISLQRIGAPTRKHVENNLNQYVTSEGATWRTITTSPQGITVSTSLTLAVSSCTIRSDRCIGDEGRATFYAFGVEGNPEEGDSTCQGRKSRRAGTHAHLRRRICRVRTVDQRHAHTRRGRFAATACRGRGRSIHQYCVCKLCGSHRSDVRTRRRRVAATACSWRRRPIYQYCVYQRCEPTRCDGGGSSSVKYPPRPDAAAF